MEEKLTVQVLLNGKVLHTFDMGKSSKGPDFKETLQWYASGHVKATEKFFPYYASLHLSRPDNKVVNQQMEELAIDAKTSTNASQSLGQKT